MKFKYYSVDGTIVEIETKTVDASQAVEDSLKESQREEWANNKKQSRYTISSDAQEYEGLDYGYYDDYFAADKRKAELMEIHKILSLLTETERRRAMMLYRGMSQTQIAAKEGVSIQSINDSVKAMRKKIKKFLKKP